MGPTRACPRTPALAVAVGMLAAATGLAAPTAAGASEPEPAGAAATEHATTHDLTLLATTEVHTNLMPWDYYNDARSERIGLAKTATLIEDARAEHDNTLLFDTGDILQGAFLGEYVASIDPLEPGEVHPAVAAMNVLDYDALTLGNHEFDFGLDFLEQVMADAEFPQISANVFRVDDQGEMTEPLVDPYVILDTEVDGVPLRAGVIGITPPMIMTWHRARLEGRVDTITAMEALERYLPEIAEQDVDLTILSAHAGKRLEFGAEEDPDGENWLWHAAERFQDDLDAILFGHEQSVFPGASKYDDVEGLDNERGLIHGVPAVMAGVFGDHLGKVHLELRHEDGDWTVLDGWSENVPVTADTPEHEGVVEAVRERHEATIEYVRSPVGETDLPITHYFTRVMDTKAVELVNDAQIAWGEHELENTEYADLPVLSAAAPFRAGRSSPDEYTYIPPGEVSVRDLADLYIYPNTAHIVQLDGSEVVEWLEWSARNFNRIDPGAAGEQELIDTSVPPYNFDVIDGIEYQYDVTQPVGQRVVSATYEGEPLDDTMQFAVVTNNYRADGGGSFPNMDGSRTIAATDHANRAILVSHVIDAGVITGEADHNWSILPVDVEGTVVFRSSPDAADHIDDVGLTGVEFLEVRDGWGVYEYLFEPADVGEPGDEDPTPPSCEGVERARFPDVPSGYAHADAIGCAATLGLVRGWPNGEFRPLLELTRGQLSSILLRALEASGIELTDEAEGFADIEGSTHEVAIRKLAAAGIVLGRSSTEFAPLGSVTRGQLATMVDRASTQLLSGYPQVEGPRFSDTPGSPHAGAIDRLNAADIAFGYDGQRFGPNDAVNRGQSASFVTRWLSDQAERLS
jgi:2',3'-cyclic-nucleotide 2'-phosphodiesterase